MSILFGKKVEIPTIWTLLVNSVMLCVLSRFFIFYRAATAPSGPGLSHNQGFTSTLRHTALGRTSDQPDAEVSTWQHTTLKQTPMSSAGFKTTIPASERPQAHTLDRATTGIGVLSQFHCCTAKCLMFDDSVRWVGPVTLEDGVDTFLRNVGNHIPSDAASHARGLELHGYCNRKTSHVARSLWAYKQLSVWN
jgi:hypothetical protein